MALLISSSSMVKRLSPESLSVISSRSSTIDRFFQFKIEAIILEGSSCRLSHRLSIKDLIADSFIFCISILANADRDLWRSLIFDLTSLILSFRREGGNEHVGSFISVINFSMFSLIWDHSRGSGQWFVRKNESLKRSRNELTFLAAIKEGLI